MSRAAKRLEAMRHNAKGDWTIGDVKIVCRLKGIACEAPTGGSHYDISHPSKRDILTIPFRKPIKPMYIRLLVAFVDAVQDDDHVRP